MKAITVRQPWAWLLIHGGKDIENRCWPTNYRGKIAIHAAKEMTRDEWLDAVLYAEYRGIVVTPDFDELVRGAVIGTMILRDCVTDHESPWFEGPYGFVMTNPVPCDACWTKGALGLWEWNAPAVRP